MYFRQASNAPTIITIGNRSARAAEAYHLRRSTRNSLCKGNPFPMARLVGHGTQTPRLVSSIPYVGDFYLEIERLPSIGQQIGPASNERAARYRTLQPTPANWAGRKKSRKQ